MKTKSKYEKIFTALIVLFMVGTILCESIFSAAIESGNATKQRLLKEINTQEELNLGMQMKINELSSLDNALSVANNYGLSYNNSNIKVIEE